MFVSDAGLRAITAKKTTHGLARRESTNVIAQTVTQAIDVKCVSGNIML